MTRQHIGMIISLSLLTGSIVAGCSHTPKDTPQITAPKDIAISKIRHVEAAEAAGLLKATPDITVLDVRTPEEYAEGHIIGSRLINFHGKNFDRQLSQLDREATYLVHCRSGRRSTKALTSFKNLGFKNVIHLDGGFKGWREADLPIEN